MSVQYISDEKGNHTAVLISIEDWLKIEKQIQDLKKNNPPIKLSEKYAGKLPSKVADELQEHVKQSREEWSKQST